MHDNIDTIQSLSRTAEALGVHDHLCLIYETQKEQFSAILPFIRTGLMRGDKCVYIADDNTASQVMEAMISDGIDVDKMQQKGSLVILNKQDAYLKQGSFDPDWMIDFLKDATDSATKDGFSALRVMGEMTWALGGDPGVERLIEYEAKLNEFFPFNKALAVCQYNLNRFSPEIIIDVIRTHPLVIYKETVCNNFYYVPPKEFLKPDSQSLEVRRLLDNILRRNRLEEKIRKSNEGLETSVRSRTNELTTANEMLKGEIAERKQAEEALMQSLRDKEMLIKEIHHRVKNNLTVVQSLLGLQSREIKDRKSKTYFIESQNRIKTMSMIHERLYGSEGMVSIHMGEYIKSLTAQLFHSYKVSTNTIRLYTDIPDVQLDVDTMMPCGLIINELISNALKYAFPDDREGKLSIGLSLAEDNEYILVIRDNGIGLPEDLDFHNTESMGIMIVKSLIEQIEGRLELKREEGTEFRITFKEKRFRQ
jgi:two-component sensor histidine kinase